MFIYMRDIYIHVYIYIHIYRYTVYMMTCLACSMSQSKNPVPRNAAGKHYQQADPRLDHMSAVGPFCNIRTLKTRCVYT